MNQFNPEGRYTHRCEGITSAGKQCKCWATQKVNEIPLCDVHAHKQLRAIEGFCAHGVLRDLCERCEQEEQ